jgi:hypothetical protein
MPVECTGGHQNVLDERAECSRMEYDTFVQSIMPQVRQEILEEDQLMQQITKLFAQRGTARKVDF